jgi:hypothetical protein
MKRKSPRTEDATTVYERLREILQSAKVTVSRSVNTTQVVANWLIGREIVEEEQRGKRRAEYGEKLLAVLSELLKAEFGAGYSVPNLRNMRQFYQVFPVLLHVSENRYALRSECHPGGPDVGWPKWCEDRAERSTCVLIIPSTWSVGLIAMAEVCSWRLPRASTIRCLFSSAVKCRFDSGFKETANAFPEQSQALLPREN